MRAHVLKVLGFFLAAGVIAFLVFSSDQGGPRPGPPPPPPLPAAAVTLGDSTLSGEGGGQYEPGTNGERNDWCHRSPAAAINQIQLPAGVTRINLACSGAQAKLVGSDPSPEHAEGSQAQRLAALTQRFRVTTVIVQVGANDDPNFADLVNRCVSAWASHAPHGCSEALGPEWTDRVARMQPKVADAIRDVRDVLDRAGYAPNSYSLVLQSYASPVSPSMPPELQNLSGCPFETPDLAWIRDTAVPVLSDGLRAVAEQTGARFLDLTNAGRGHEACTGGAAHQSNEWFTRLSVDWPSLQDEQRAPHAMQESFHSNPNGHTQFARCLSEFLATTEPRAACLADDSGNLHAVEGANTDQRFHP